MPDLGDLCRVAVDAAESGEAVEAYAEESRRTEAKALRGEVEGLQFSESRGVGVRVIRDSRLGYAWAADPDADEVRDVVRRARENAALSAEDEHNVLPEPGRWTPIPELYPGGIRHRPHGGEDPPRIGPRGASDLARPARDEGRRGPGGRRRLAGRDRLHDRRRSRIRPDRCLVPGRDPRRRGRRDADGLLLPDRARAGRPRVGGGRGRGSGARGADARAPRSRRRPASLSSSISSRRCRSSACSWEPSPPTRCRRAGLCSRTSSANRLARSSSRWWTTGRPSRVRVRLPSTTKGCRADEPSCSRRASWPGSSTTRTPRTRAARPRRATGSVGTGRRLASGRPTSTSTRVRPLATSCCGEPRAAC